MAKDRAPTRSKKPQGVEPTEELNTVRELLFGERMREMEALRKETDARLTAAIGELGHQLSETIEELRQQLQKDLFELTNRLGAESSDRSRQGRELEQAIHDARSDLQRNLDTEGTSLRDELRSKHETAIRRVGEEAAALSEAKADRTAVAELLSKMATELRDGSAPSDDA